MTQNVGSSRQFSLCSLLAVVLVSALVLGAWRVLGGAVWLAGLFALLSAICLWLLKGPWQRAGLLSFSAVYGPFVVMATYTLLYVSCSHCQAAAWTLLPYAPALVLVELVRAAFDLPRLPEWLNVAVALFVSAAMVLALAWIVRTRGFWWRALSIVAMLAYSALAAIATLAVIRA
jgi:hypothetical protein